MIGVHTNFVFCTHTHARVSSSSIRSWSFRGYWIRRERIFAGEVAEEWADKRMHTAHDNLRLSRLVAAACAEAIFRAGENVVDK